MVHRILIFVLWCFSGHLLADHPVLEKYISEGLQANLALQEREFSYQQSTAALNEARGMFLPSATIEARYSRAGGGRNIDFPIGDIINPIHQSLNALLQQPAFPANLENESIPFLREEEHDTKLRVVQPIFQPAIYHNYQAKKHQKEIELAAREAYKRLLIADIKRAYYNYLKTVQLTKLLQETEKLLQENLRVSEKLFAAEKVTEDVVFRARVELSRLIQSQAAAERDLQLAKAYFNFLLNRSLDEAVEEVAVVTSEVALPADLAKAEAAAVKQREEFKQLNAAIAAAGSGVGAAKSAFLPGVSLVLDYGFQGETYSFGKNDDYWMASAVMQWNLFNGFQDKAKVQQAVIAQKKIESRIKELDGKIRLQVREAFYNCQVAGKNLLTAREQLNSARKSFRIVERKYREGIAAQIEFLDARNTLTNAETNRIIAEYDYFIFAGEFEQVTAAYPLSKDN